MTYMVDGVQYVAVAAGGNLLLDTPRGDFLYVFTVDGRGRMTSPTVAAPDDTIPEPTAGGGSPARH